MCWWQILTNLKGWLDYSWIYFIWVTLTSNLDDIVAGCGEITFWCWGIELTFLLLPRYNSSKMGCPLNIFKTDELYSMFNNARNSTYSSSYRMPVVAHICLNAVQLAMPCCWHPLCYQQALLLDWGNPSADQSLTGIDIDYLGISHPKIPFEDHFLYILFCILCMNWFPRCRFSLAMKGFCTFNFGLD